MITILDVSVTEYQAYMLMILPRASVDESDGVNADFELFEDCSDDELFDHD